VSAQCARKMVLDLNSPMEAQEGCDSTNGIKMVRMYKLGCYKGNACLLHTQPGLDYYHCSPAPHLSAPASISCCLLPASAITAQLVILPSHFSGLTSCSPRASHPPPVSPLATPILVLPQVGWVMRRSPACQTSRDRTLVLG